jgi:hypothetical protein
MRLEVIVRELGDIEEIAEFLKQQRISKVNVCHVSKGVDPVQVAGELLRRFPGIDVIPYLSLKHYSRGSMDDASTGFRRAFEDARRVPFRRILVVSGHPRQTFETIDALRAIQTYGLSKETEVYCAYNPFFDPARQRDENERLRQKLAFPFVNAVCFQIGMDTEKLRKAVEFVRTIRPDIRLFGEVPVPSERTIQRLKLVALYGVFLPNCYFLSAETAQEMTTAILAAYAAHGVEPVVFSAHVKDVEDALPLFV